ncbi:hypothetical protein V1525DRAFT_422312 [Lipomyces kononenkoae]|uniref:Uncharacterized protein n=1 Tax=Lipomyces kononenkoae TaxID=34357 RepID=A0ACC3SS18_LIPKO
MEESPDYSDESDESDESPDYLSTSAPLVRGVGELPPYWRTCAPFKRKLLHFASQEWCRGNEFVAVTNAAARGWAAAPKKLAMRQRAAVLFLVFRLLGVWLSFNAIRGYYASPN